MFGFARVTLVSALFPMEPIDPGFSGSRRDRKCDAAVVSLRPYPARDKQKLGGRSPKARFLVFLQS